MGSPDLPITVDSTYADSAADPSVKLHQLHHDTLHRLVNLFDTANAARSGTVLIGNGVTFLARALRSTDIPAVVTNARSGSYVLVVSDAGKMVEMNVAAANTLTIPPHSAVAFGIGTVVNVRQYGSGATTVEGGVGVTVRSRGGLKMLAGRYAEATLTKRATDEWLLIGDLA